MVKKQLILQICACIISGSRFYGQGYTLFTDLRPQARLYVHRTIHRTPWPLTSKPLIRAPRPPDINCSIFRLRAQSICVICIRAAMATIQHVLLCRLPCNNKHHCHHIHCALAYGGLDECTWRTYASPENQPQFIGLEVLLWQTVVSEWDDGHAEVPTIPSSIIPSFQCDIGGCRSDLILMWSGYDHAQALQSLNADVQCLTRSYPHCYTLTCTNVWRPAASH